MERYYVFNFRAIEKAFILKTWTFFFFQLVNSTFEFGNC